MAYLMLVLGIGYSVAWGMGLMFASKSDGPKNTILPGLGLLAFLGLSAVSASAAKTAMDTDQRLHTESYMGLAYDQTLGDVEGRLGKALADPDRSTFDLTGKGIVITQILQVVFPAWVPFHYQLTILSF